MIFMATMLFGGGFLFCKLYQKSESTALPATLLFALINSAVISLEMLILNGIRIEFSLFSFVVALWYAANSLLYTYCSLKALAYTNLSLYSMFAMLGGMLLPFVGGILFWKEALTFPKLLSCAITAVALKLCVQKNGADKKAILYYLLVFVFNGCNGIISKVHQSAENGQNISEIGFLLLANLSVFFVCILSLLIFFRGKVRPVNLKSAVTYGIGYAVSNGSANLLLLIALRYLDASVQYPLVTGGTIIVSAVISFFMKERMTKKHIVAVALAFLSALIVIRS